MSLVRDLTRLSRAEHRAFHSRDCAEGMWTEGKSIRLETSLSSCASFLSVFTLRLPTPKDFTRVAGTTLTSCPIWIASSDRCAPRQLSPGCPERRFEISFHLNR